MVRLYRNSIISSAFSSPTSIPLVEAPLLLRGVSCLFPCSPASPDTLIVSPKLDGGAGHVADVAFKVGIWRAVAQ